MEKIFSKPHIYLAILWLAVKILIYYLFPGKDLFMIGAALNLIFILLIVVVNIKKTIGENSFLIQLKTLLQPTITYTFLIALAIYIYYSQVDPGFIQNKIDLSRQALPDAIDSMGGFDAYKDKFPNIKEDNIEDFLKEQNRTTPSLLSAHGQALFSTFGLLLMSSISSIFFLVVSRSATKVKNR